MGITPEPSRFFHGAKGHPSEPVIVLWRSQPEELEQWQLVHPLGYLDRKFGAIIVPSAPTTFRTDLTSVPQMFTWLVPRTGEHLPAALVHDGLTPPRAGEYNGDPAINQIDADRIFRDAMADLRTPHVRRWLVWSAVSLPTAWQTGRWRSLPGYASLVVIALMGFFASLDLFDCGEWLPWMGGRAWHTELLFGLGMALVIPVALSLLWLPRLRLAGAICGTAIAFLLHVTVAVAAVTAGYQLVEWCASRFSKHYPRRSPLVSVAVLASFAALIWLIWFMWRRYAPVQAPS
jgi:Protein of unknown function (DUF1353)